MRGEQQQCEQKGFIDEDVDVEPETPGPFGEFWQKLSSWLWVQSGYQQFISRMVCAATINKPHWEC